MAFKTIVALTFIQSVCFDLRILCLKCSEADACSLMQVIFNVLDGRGNLKPTPLLTFADINMGIPSMIICIEMVPLSLLFFLAYSVRPYTVKTPRRDIGLDVRAIHYQGGRLGLRAWLQMWNLREILHGIGFAFGMTKRMKHDVSSSASVSQPSSELVGVEYQLSEQMGK